MSDEPSKCTNYLRIVRLIVDIGTETVRKLFFHFKPRSRVQAFFQSQTICGELNDLRCRHILTKEQYDRLVFDPDPNPDEFDLSLLLTLLTNLFKTKIDKPIKGWVKHVYTDHTTLGGDLLRLKNIRNKIVGHSPNTDISSSEFEELWTQTENVLMRITQCVDSTKKQELAAKISDYKTSALDATSERKYMSLLNAWHEEAFALLSHLKEEVEMLCKNAEGFDIFFRSKIPDRYLRYILLLCEGGLSVLAGVMNRELEKHQTSLSGILMQNKQALIASNTNASSTVFTEDGKIITDISLWGGKLLSDVILILFHTNLTPVEETAISTIGTSCNDYEKIAMESLDSDRFFRMYWTDLVSSINVLANGLDSKTQSECMLLIKKHKNDKIDEDAAKGYLTQLRRGCEPFQSLVEQYIELREKLKRTVEQMQREGACFGRDQVIELKMMTFGTTEEKRQLAENILYTMWQAGVSKTGGSSDFPKVKAAIEQILKDVYNIPGIKTIYVEKQCILLTVTCKTFQSLTHLLDFMARPMVWKYMKLASRELTSYYEERIVVTAFITAESMQSALESLDDENQRGITSSIGIKFGCPSTDDTKIVNYLLQRKETSNSINQMAEELSEQLKEKISISTSVKAGGILITNSDPLVMVSKSQWTHFLPSTGVSLQEQVPETLALYSRRNQNKFSPAQQPPAESVQQTTAQPAQQPKSHQSKAQQLPAQQQPVQSDNQSIALQGKTAELLTQSSTHIIKSPSGEPRRCNSLPESDEIYLYMSSNSDLSLPLPKPQKSPLQYIFNIFRRHNLPKLRSQSIPDIRKQQDPLC